MAKVDLSPETVKQADELAKLFKSSPAEAISGVVARFHRAYFGDAGKLPDGWTLKDDLTLTHLEDYFAAYNTHASTGSMWEERGRTIRAAIDAGWFATPEGLKVEDAGKLTPGQAIGANDAIDAHYTRLTTADPK